MQPGGPRRSGALLIRWDKLKRALHRYQMADGTRKTIMLTLSFVAVAVAFTLLGSVRPDGARAAYADVWHQPGAGPSLFTEVKKVAASGAVAGNNFGVSVAAHGDTVVVGEYHYSLGATHSGAAYVFRRDQGGPGNWGLVRRLLPSDPGAYDHFGRDVAIHGDTIVIGAMEADDACTGNVDCDSGAAYLFERDEGGPANWGQVRKLNASNAALGDYFGIAVGIDTDTVVIGAQLKDYGSSANQGAAYIFERNQGGSGMWGQTKIISDTLGALNDRFGSSVAISADTLAVGALTCDKGGLRSGCALVFERDQGGSGNWGVTARLFPDDGLNGGYFGSDVDIDQDLLAVGAPGHFGSLEDQGAVYLYGRNQGTPGSWGLVGQLLAADPGSGANFGDAVAIEGDTLLAGAPGTPEGGAVYAFYRDQGGLSSWGQLQKLSASDAFAGDGFGSAAALFGITAVVGAPFDDDACPINPSCNAGSAYLFQQAGVTLDATLYLPLISN